jgi:hypothetical protein
MGHDRRRGHAERWFRAVPGIRIRGSMETLGLLVHQCLFHSSAQVLKGLGITVDIMRQIRR